MQLVVILKAAVMRQITLAAAFKAYRKLPDRLAVLGLAVKRQFCKRVLHK